MLGGIVLVGLLIVLNMALFGWLMYRALSRQELNRILTQTRAEAEELARTLEGEVDREGEDLFGAIVSQQETQTYIDRVLARRDIVATVRIYDRDGTKIFENITEATESGEEPLTLGEAPQVERRILESETAYPVVSVPVGAHGSFVIGLSQVELQRRVETLRSELLSQAAPIVAFTLVLLVSAYVLVLWLLGRGRALEERAEEAEQMAYIGTLASGLAHEIRSPLNSLNLNMQMLEEEGAGGSVGSRRRLVEITRSEITRLEKLVTDFLSYARPRPSQLEEHAAVDLVARVQEVLAAQAAAHDVSLEIDDRSHGAVVLVDSDQINQLLLNLTQNALAAIPEDAAKARVVLVVREDGAAVVLEVIDNGVGIGEAERKQVFDLFYSTRRGGTGLGLAIARRIATAHGTEVVLEQVPGGGTKASFRLSRVGRRDASWRPPETAATPTALETQIGLTETESA